MMWTDGDEYVPFIMNTFAQSTGWGLWRKYTSDIKLSGAPEFIPITQLIPDQRNTEFGLETGRACFCNER